MEFTEFALRLLLLFFPGIICFYIVEALTGSGENPARRQQHADGAPADATADATDAGNGVHNAIS